MAIDPYAAAMDALREHLAEVAGVGTATRGWPEQPEQLDFEAGAVVSLSLIGKPTSSWETPAPLTEAASGDGLLVTWRLGLTEFEVALDLWAPFRKDRDQVGEAIGRAFEPGLPFTIGLEIVCSKYYDQTASFEILSGPETLDDDQAAATGEWRQQWILSVGIGLVAQAATAKQAVQILRQTTLAYGRTVVDADITISLPG